MLNFINKIGEKSEKTRTRIFWAALIISVGIIGFFWIKSLGHSFEKLKFKSRNIEKSSENFIEELKKESPMSQLKEVIGQFEEFFKSEELKKLLEQDSQAP